MSPLELMRLVRSVRVLTGAEKAALMVLATYASDTLQAWPSKPTLAADTCMSESTVHRALDGLVTRGLIRQVARTALDVQVWQLDIEAISAAAEREREVRPRRGGRNPVTVTPGHGDTPVTMTPAPIHGDTSTPVTVNAPPVTVTPKGASEGARVEGASEGDTQACVPAPAKRPVGLTPDVFEVWELYRSEQRAVLNVEHGDAPPKTWGVAARVNDPAIGAEGMALVVRWAHRSPDARASWLRTSGCVGQTLFRPEKVREYLRMAKAWDEKARRAERARSAQRAQDDTVSPAARWVRAAFAAGHAVAREDGLDIEVVDAIYAARVVVTEVYIDVAVETSEQLRLLSSVLGEHLETAVRDEFGGVTLLMHVEAGGRTVAQA